MNRYHVMMFVAMLLTGLAAAVLLGRAGVFQSQAETELSPAGVRYRCRLGCQAVVETCVQQCVEGGN